MIDKELILDDFEHGDITKYETHHAFVKSYDISISKDHAKYGERSLRISYDYGDWKFGNGAMYVKFKEDLVTNRLPVKFSLWMYGNGKVPWLRATFMDGTGAKKTVNLTEKSFNWTGWKYLDVPIDSNWALPIKLDQIYAVETDKTHRGDANYKGEFFLDRLRFVYVDDEDLKGPTFSHIHPEGEVIYQDKFTFSVKVTDNMSGVNPNSIVVKVNNKQVNHHYCHKSSTVSYLFDQVGEGSFHISVSARDNAGNMSIPNMDKIITVDLSPDREKPVISNITPTNTTIYYTSTPRITFNLIDLKSGIEQDDIIVTLDGEKLSVYYDQNTGWCYAYPAAKLRDGKHVVSITAKDRAGNQLGPIKKEFLTREITKSKKGDDFKVSIIPDTHSVDYAQLAFRNVSKETSEFVILMGDMVDQATEEEFRCIKRTSDILENKPILAVPGNHESFQGNLDLYMKYFGSPTYHLEYSHTLIVILNSAYEQSISNSDSTQFEYLRKLLKFNDKKNVIIATHVPVKDPFGTAHEMKRYDAEILEHTLKKYKQENKTVNITVLFGHLHVLRAWEKNGVNYIIVGNGAAKGYVANDRGNILGYGILDVSHNGIKYKFKPHVDKVFIHHRDLNDSTLRMKKGTSRSLCVCGIFNKLNEDYTVNLSKFDLIDKRWTTGNKKIVSVDPTGVVFGRNKGTATVEANICGKRATIEVNVI